MQRNLTEEQTVYLQRMQVISKIRLYAAENNDEAMLKKADELEAQAEKLYLARLERLPGLDGGEDDRMALERKRDDRPASASRTPARTRPIRGIE